MNYVDIVLIVMAFILLIICVQQGLKISYLKVDMEYMAKDNESLKAKLNAAYTATIPVWHRFPTEALKDYAILLEVTQAGEVIAPKDPGARVIRKITEVLPKGNDNVEAEAKKMPVILDYVHTHGDNPEGGYGIWVRGERFYSSVSRFEKHRSLKVAT